MIASLLQRAESNGQSVRLVASAGPTAPCRREPLSPAKAREKAASLQPQPHNATRETLAKALDAGLAEPNAASMWSGSATASRMAPPTRSPPR